MFSSPCNNFYPDEHFLNSFSLGINSETLENIVESSEIPQLPSILTCEKCEIALNESVITKKSGGDSQCFCKEQTFSPKKFGSEIKRQSSSQFHCVEEPENIAKNYKKQVLLFFCLDFSGTMSTYYAMPKNYRFLEDAVEIRNNILVTQWDFGDARPHTNLTRKEVVLLHLKDQISKAIASDKHTNYRVFFLTFSNEITLFGDGTSDPVTLDQQNLETIKHSINKCKKFGKNTCDLVFSPSKAFDLDKLFEKLLKKEETGSTSLGPAIAAGLGAIGKIKPDACQFFIFTDGVANNGLGDLENPANKGKSIEEYKELGAVGFLNNVTYHIFSFKEEQSGLKILQNMTDCTQNGQLYRIEKQGSSYDADKFVEELGSAFALASRLYANDVEACIFCDPRVKTRFAQGSQENSKALPTYIYKKIGCIYDELNKLTVFFNAPKKSFSEGEKTHFQIQISFRSVSTRKLHKIVLNFARSFAATVQKSHNPNYKVANNLLFEDMILKNQEKTELYTKFLQENGDLEGLKHFFDNTGLDEPAVKNKNLKKSPVLEESKKDYYDKNKGDFYQKSKNSNEKNKNLSDSEEDEDGQTITVKLNQKTRQVKMDNETFNVKENNQKNKKNKK